MKKLVFVLIAALGISCSSYAQMSEKEIKKATKAAQALVKDAKKEMERDDVVDKSNAKRLIDQAIKNQYVKDWYLTWYEAAEVYYRFFLDEYIKSNDPSQKFDTVRCYNYLSQWIQYDMIADSLEQIPNEKGKTTREVRDNHAAAIHQQMGNFVFAGIFYFNDRSDYKKAFEMFESYFNTAEHPMLRHLVEDDSFYYENKPYYSYFAALAASRLEDWNNTLKYATIATADEKFGEPALELMCDAYKIMGDTVNWIKNLKDGLTKYPTEDYFYSNLLNYYNLKGDMAALEAFIEDMVKLDPDKANNYYVLGVIAYNNKDYAKAIDQYQKAIDRDPSLSDAYFNLGLSMIFQADAVYDSKTIDKNGRFIDSRSAAFRNALQEQKDSYRKILPYFLKYRELEPSAARRWGAPLQQIYNQLNMSKELAEVEARMKEAGMEF